MSDTVLVVGASAGIGRALAVHLAREDVPLVLAGRDGGETERVAADCRLRFGGSVAVEVVEATDFAGHEAFLERCEARAPGGLAGVIVCVGILGPEGAEPSQAEEAEIFRVNVLGCISLLERAAGPLAARGRGFLCVLGSVAGDRVRPRRAVYGLSKAVLATLVDGLRGRLAGSGVTVLTVKPGFVDTRMTYGPRALPLVASPERVARDVWRAIRAGKTQLYTPWFWRWVMALIKMMPEPLFRRLPF